MWPSSSYDLVMYHLLFILFLILFSFLLINIVPLLFHSFIPILPTSTPVREEHQVLLKLNWPINLESYFSCHFLWRGGGGKWQWSELFIIRSCKFWWAPPMHKLKKKKKKMFVKNTRGKPTFNSHVVNTNNQFPIRKWEDNPITGQYLLSRNYITPSNGSLLNSILKH